MREDVGVGVKRDVNGRMSEALADDLRMDILGQHQRCGSVTQVVESKALELGPTNQLAERVGDLDRFVWSAVILRKHQAFTIGPGPPLSSRLGLLASRSEEIQGRCG